MTSRDLADRIVGQFSDESERADIWRGLDLFLDTGAYLNLGYSGRFQTHLVGSPQGRLVAQVVDRLGALRDDPAGERLLDVGCGRGVPTARAAAGHRFEAVGVDLVPHNLRLARKNVADRSHGPDFVVADATRLPLGSGTVAACIAIDSIVYVPDVRGTYAELARVLEVGGHAVVSDLVAVDPRTADEAGVDRGVLERFGREWDMPVPTPFPDYASAIEAAGFDVLEALDISANSVAGFRKWATLYLALADGPTGPLLSRLLDRRGLDPSVVTEQIRAARAALPALRHVLLALRR